MFSLYKETPFRAKPATPGAVVSFQIPAHDGSYRYSNFNLNSPQKRRKIDARDEQSYAKQYLATQSSIYFRKSNTYPRTFFWRVIEDDNVLEVQCADLARSEHDLKEAYLTLSFEFQDPIIPNGVVLADHDNKDVLVIFAITSRKELHTLSIPTDFFRSHKASAGDVRKWCNSIVPSSFTIDQPHQFYANNPYELFISFDSGRLQRLTRGADEKGTSWMQDNYDDKSWGATIRGIVSRRAGGAIPFGSRLLDSSTPHAILASSDSTYAFTVCLNHTLRIWNLSTGRLVVTKDLLDKQRPPQDQLQINPAESAFVRLFKNSLMVHSILVTYSPLGGGQFKFWNVRGGLTDPLAVEDRFPGVRLTPPDPDPSGNTVWSLTGFEVRPGDPKRPTELWVLWRNNNHHQLYSLHFNLETLPEDWEENWTLTVSETKIGTSAPDFVAHDETDPTEKWIDFLLYPGRYPAEVLEISLLIYQDALSSKQSSSAKYRSLQDRLCSSIATSVTLRKYSESDLDYERFNVEVDAQWRNFWKIACSINSQRQAPLSLALDKYADIAYISMTDQCCAIRECSRLELLSHTRNEDMQQLENVAASRWPHRRISPEGGEPLERVCLLANAASAFRQQFSAELNRDIRCALAEELFQEAELPVADRILYIYEKCNFGGAITQEAYEQVITAIEHLGGEAGFNTQLIFALLESFPEGLRTEKSNLCTTIFGSNIVEAGLHETILLSREILFDVVVLVVFVESEVNQDKAFTDFNAPEAFSHLLVLLKEYEKNLWLAKNTRHVRIDTPEALTIQNVGDDPDQSNTNTRVVSVLYDVFGRDIRPQPAVEKPRSYLMSEMLHEVLSWLAGAQEVSTENALVYIQCNLIVRKDYALANEFLRFQPNNPWSTYIKGRLYLCRSEFDAAATFFKKAAYSLAYGKAVGQLNEMSSGLLSMLDAQSFISGLPAYFQHVLALFEMCKAFAHAAEFAQLALQSMSPDQKPMSFSFKTEILSRLFTAELKSSHFSGAFTALAQFTDRALQRTSAAALIDAMLMPGSVLGSSVDIFREIRTFPFGLYPQLAQIIEEHFQTLAEKRTTLSAGPVSKWSSESGSNNLRLLHALYVSRNDYGSAINVLLDKMRLIKHSRSARSDPQALQYRNALLALVNALSCVDPDEAYLLTEADESGEYDGRASNGLGGKPTEKTEQKAKPRIVITLDDLRKEYQQLLDRCSRIERGDFDFAVDGEESGDDEEGPMQNGHVDEMEL